MTDVHAVEPADAKSPVATQGSEVAGPDARDFPSFRQGGQFSLTRTCARKMYVFVHNLRFLAFGLSCNLPS